MINYGNFKFLYFKIEKDKYQKICFSHWKYELKHDVSNFNFILPFDNYSILMNKQSSFQSFQFYKKNFFYLNNNNNYFDYNYINENYSLNTENILENFFYLRKLSFINFFINNAIDVPICFKKSKSLKNKNFELPLLKFTNYLMKKGKKEKINRQILNATEFFFFLLKKNNVILNFNIKNWINIFFLYNKFFYNFDESDYIFKTILPKFSTITNYHTLVDVNNFTDDSSYYLKNFILSRLSQVLPIFSYYIHSVDKNIRKFSRGKSGKYKLIWKYVASYKRLYLAFKWIVKDVKFFSSKKLIERIAKTFYNLSLEPQFSLIWKLKIFSHNFVYKNFKKTLMSSLKTIF